MPAASHSPTGTTSQGSILLIEEYDALAAAISSALRKFAPAHSVHVAQNLNEAKALAKDTEFSLLVIDFDPPFTGLSAFLQKMQTNMPDARVLLIAGKLPADVATAARSATALQFVEKPFDVPDFGAAVQALLGPWRKSESETSRGTLHDLTLADLVVAQCAGGRTTAIEVTKGSGKSGEIHLRQGTPSHAQAGRKTGEEALEEMLGWLEVEVREREKPGTTKRTIHADWPNLLVETFRRAKPRPAKSARKTAAPHAPPKTGEKLVVVDDTEMLLIFVEDVLMTNNRDYQITTAPNGVTGIKAIEKAKPDLVLLDYSLPDINGDEVCRRLLQNDATSRIPVLMMSGHVPEMAKAAATLDNVVATIEKPFRSEALVSLVQQVLTERRPVRKKAPPARKSATPAAIPSVVPGKASAPEQAPTSLKPEATQPSEVVSPISGQPAAAVEPSEASVSEPETSTTSVVQKARRAIEQFRKQLIPDEKPGDRADVVSKPPPPPPPPPEKVAAEDVPREPEPTRAGFISTRALSEGPNEVVLSLLLEVVSVQLTPELRMGSIRAKPASDEVSLHFVSPGMRDRLLQTGFRLGEVALDGKERISTVRLIPTRAPFKGGFTQNELQIGGVSVVPMNSTNRMQLTPAPEKPMTLQLLAHLEIAGVELSPTFQVSQLVLKDRGRPIRVTLNSQSAGQEDNGTACETVAVRLDHAGRIVELLLNPVR